MEEFDPALIKPQSRIRLALRYSKEWIFWAFSGFKYRTQEEINEIHSICSDCIYYEKYSEDSGACGICGCPINKEISKANKAAYVTASCPHKDKKWLRYCLRRIYGKRILPPE